MTEHVLVQNSKYWNTWRALNVLSMQVNVFSAKIDVDSGSALRSSQVDPYVVVFLSKDRSESKKKTSILKKTLAPVWNESVMFSNFDINDSICVEIKMPAWGTINPVIACTTFTVEDLIRMNSEDLVSKRYALQSPIPGVSAELVLGFVFDGNSDLLDKTANDVNDFRLKQKAQDARADRPVYLNTKGAHACFLFCNEAEGVSVTGHGSGAQVIPHDANTNVTSPSTFSL
jgi:hypothetical protein